MKNDTVRNIRGNLYYYLISITLYYFFRMFFFLVLVAFIGKLLDRRGGGSKEPKAEIRGWLHRVIKVIFFKQL